MMTNQYKRLEKTERLLAAREKISKHVLYSFGIVIY